MVPQDLRWQPGSDEWHGDGEADDPPLEFGSAYGEDGEGMDDRFDRHPEADVPTTQRREPWYRTF